MELCAAALGWRPAAAVELAGAGSGRRYWRLLPAADDARAGAVAVIGTCGTVRRENEAFIYLSERLRREGVSVPRVLAVSADGMLYVQSDAGRRSLLEAVAAAGGPAAAEELLHEAMAMLPVAQRAGLAEGFDAARLYPREAMDRRAVMWDLNYFKYSFLKPAGIEPDEELLERDMLRLADMAARGARGRGLMMRDYQARNLMVADGPGPGPGRLTVIDFQGARLGDGVYDAASFLWQARAGYGDDLRHRLLATYRRAAAEAMGRGWLRGFDRRYGVMSLLRLLQVLGAYGFRGLVQHKAQFTGVMARAVANIGKVLELLPAGGLPYLHGVLGEVAAMERFAPEGEGEWKGLTVTVTSFSYRLGVPEDMSGNGGGFVFDCRSLHNPGRYDCYRGLTGMDAEVVNFLEERGEVQPFLRSCEALTDAAVERYVARGFTRLAVSFGCTGGRHRSVYCAEAMARHLSERFGSAVRVRLVHREQGAERIYEPQRGEPKP